MSAATAVPAPRPVGCRQWRSAVRTPPPAPLQDSPARSVRAADKRVRPPRPGDAEGAPPGDETAPGAAGARAGDVAAGEDSIGPGGRPEPHCPARCADAAAYSTADFHGAPGDQQRAAHPAYDRDGPAGRGDIPVDGPRDRDGPAGDVEVILHGL